MRSLNVPRVQIFRSSRHIRAQLVNASGSQVLAQASTLDADLRASHQSNIAGAKAVGKLLAERIKKLKDLDQVGFDRSGYKYHGKVLALAEALRSEGIKI